MRKEKLTNKCLCSISSFYRSSHGRASAKKVFLKILQYSQENTCVEVSLQAFRFAILLIRGINTYGFLRILRNFKEHHFEEHLRTTASYFMNKNRNNSSKKKKINQGILNLWIFNFVNWHGYKKIAHKSKQVENCPALPELKLISTCNRRVRSVPAGRGEISSRQTGMM